MEQFNDEEKPIVTCNYGSVLDESKLYDMKDILKDKMLNYKITKIKCQIKSNEGIYGIELFYRNLIDGKETSIINVQSKEKDLIEQVFDLCGDYIIDMRVWINNDIKLIGFEIVTNRNRIFKFGYGKDEQLVKIPDLKNLDKIIIGFGFYINEGNSISSIYAYYINKSNYFYHVYKGILYLRSKSQNKEYNEKMQKKLSSISKRNQILFRICNLPQSQFFNIMKYTQ